MQLRPYQAAALDEIRAAYRAKIRRVLLVAPTGAGKSAMTRHMLGNTNMTSLILVHRQELLEMVGEGLPPDHGLILPGRSIPDRQICLGMMQTVSRRLDVLPKFQWVLSDEAHLAMCATWQAILDHYGDSWHLGMSATPCRLDGKGLGTSYDKIVMGPTIAELTMRGFLTPCRVYAPPSDTVDAFAAGSRAAEFSMQQAAAMLDKASITGDAIAHYEQLAFGKQAIVFCASREHGENVAQQFRQAGHPAVFVDGDMPKYERASRIQSFRDRRVRILVNVDLLTTGFDCPQIEVGIFLRPTQSLALYLQMIGRILRLFPGKAHATLLDHVGNVKRHGLPDSEREWTLDGAPVRNKAPAIKQCPMCYLVHSPGPRCPGCSYTYTAAVRPRKLQQQSGTLVEITGKPGEPMKPALLPIAQVLKGVKTKEELVRIALERGYSMRWVAVQCKVRHIKAQAAVDVSAASSPPKPPAAVRSDRLVGA